MCKATESPTMTEESKANKATDATAVVKTPTAGKPSNTAAAPTNKPSLSKQSSSRGAFQGAPFDKAGFCLHHPKVQLSQPIKNDQGKLMYQELKRTCPNCQQEKHKSKKGTSLGGGKVREGRSHGYKPSAMEKTEERRARSVSRARSKSESKPRKEYDTPFDEKGRCHYHKNTQLATKKLAGGWKVVHSICPKCMEDRYDDDRSVKSSSSRKSSKSLSSKLDGGRPTADGQYDKNGCCVLHTHIQVAKKRVFGSGWKVVRTCPACEKGEVVGLDDDRMSVCSKSSRKSSRSVGSRSVKSSRSTAEKGKAKSSSRYGSLPFDGDGYCCRHPSVQLAQKKMMGGFKIIHDICPECDAEGGGGGGKRRVPRRKSSSGTGRVFDDSGSECSGSVSSSKKQKRKRVKNMKTEDENGKHGRYSGDVDADYSINSTTQLIMMKLAVLAALAGSAVAFAPSQQGSASTSLSATEAQKDFFGITSVDFSKELGVQPPLGLWDPLGLLSDGDQSTFDDLREKEIKHGRVSMLAIVGYLTTAAGVRFPGAEEIPDGLASWGALLNSADGRNVLTQMGAFMVVAEIVNRDAEWLDNKAEFVGDYRNGALDFGWDKWSDSQKMKKRSIELNNGRAAMMGIWGLVTHEVMGVSILPGNYLPGHP